ncbi:uncharacterized protein LOC127797797 [Diospyros lotus]|uniref:uncharacterized protein LOC127797797 n=1 Tax=Diospyros lotus TaxID=55363 RepID=UPI002252DE38|nr:uncharacterized protein LOC127797797 [Diospyros lotus]
MKAMKGKWLKKLKSIKQMGYLKTDRVLQVYASDGFVDSLPKIPIFPAQTQKEEPKMVRQSSFTVQEPEIIDVSELMKDLEEDEMEFDDDDKENIRPGAVVEKQGIGKLEPLSEINVENFRRPDLDSGSLFDPNLLSAFEQAVMAVKTQEEEIRARRIDDEPPMKARKIEEDPPLDSGKSRDLLPDSEENRDPPSFSQENRDPRKIQENGGSLLVSQENRNPLSDLEENRDPLFVSRENEFPPSSCQENRDPLLEFEEKCPPGGGESVILYTTGLRGIRKTFEDCSSVRFLLETFRVLFFERDISMHSEFREELWRILGEKTVPPRLFIKGRYVGGAEKVLSLHEQGKLRRLLEVAPVDRSEGPCEGCGGVRFVMCFNCSGSHKVVSGESGLSEKCPECNENGLIICPICC